jgi:hypothetical protein
LLLRLANVGWVCAWLTPLLWVPGFVGFGLGVAVCVLANRDLAMMEAGLMDRDGRLDTEQALAFGVRAVLLSVAALLLCAYPCLALFSFLVWPGYQHGP